MLALLAFVAVQVPAGIAVAFARTWSGVGEHAPSLSALDLTGVIAALTVVILAGGHATIPAASQYHEPRPLIPRGAARLHPP